MFDALDAPVAVLVLEGAVDSASTLAGVTLVTGNSLLAALLMPAEGVIEVAGVPAAVAVVVAAFVTAVVAAVVLAVSSLPSEFVAGGAPPPR